MTSKAGHTAGPNTVRIEFDVRKVKRGLWTYDIYQDGFCTNRAAGECRSKKEAISNARRVVAGEVPQVQWLTTAPNPRASITGSDAGQRGWRRHAIRTQSDLFSELRFAASECGLRPSHGWGLDLFITDKCARCLTAIAQAEGGAS